MDGFMAKRTRDGVSYRSWRKPTNADGSAKMVKIPRNCVLRKYPALASVNNSTPRMDGFAG